MMKIGLRCSSTKKTILMELLSARGITIQEKASVYVVEAGCDIPTDGISVIFQANHLDNLMELLEKLVSNQDNELKTVIGRSPTDSYEIIPLERVYYFEARGNNVFCAMDNQEYRVKEKLYELESKLPKNSFLRVGKSFIVNIYNVKEIIPWFGRRLVLKFIGSKVEIEVSKNYVKNLKEFLGM